MQQFMKPCNYFLGLKKNDLVSAGLELIFFLVAGTVLCFGCSMRIILITY